MQDREQPRLQVGPGREAIAGAERLQVRVLDEVLGPIGVARESERGPIQTVEERESLRRERIAVSPGLRLRAASAKKHGYRRRYGRKPLRGAAIPYQPLPRPGFPEEQKAG